jgi:hypothetical protein
VLRDDYRHTHSRQPVADYDELVQPHKTIHRELCSERCKCGEATDRSVIPVPCGGVECNAADAGGKQREARGCERRETRALRPWRSRTVRRKAAVMKRAKTSFSLGGAGRARLGSRPRGANFEGRGRAAEGCQTARGTEKSEQAHGALHAVLLRQQSQLGSVEVEVAAAVAW